MEIFKSKDLIKDCLRNVNFFKKKTCNLQIKFNKKTNKFIIFKIKSSKSNKTHRLID